MPLARSRCDVAIGHGHWPWHNWSFKDGRRRCVETWAFGLTLLGKWFGYEVYSHSSNCTTAQRWQGGLHHIHYSFETVASCSILVGQGAGQFPVWCGESVIHGYQKIRVTTHGDRRFWCAVFHFYWSLLARLDLCRCCLRHVSFPIAQSWWFSIRSSTLVAGPSNGEMPCISSKSLDVWDTNLMYMVRFMWWSCVVVLLHHVLMGKFWNASLCFLFISFLKGIWYFCLSSSATTGNFIQCSNQCLWKRLLSAICLTV